MAVPQNALGESSILKQVEAGPSHDLNTPGPSQPVARESTFKGGVKVARNFPNFENHLESSREIDLDSILYTTDLNLLSCDALKQTLKSLKVQTRDLERPTPSLKETIEDIEFTCFIDKDDFENYSKFDVQAISERLLERKASEQYEAVSAPSQFMVPVPKVAQGPIRRRPHRPQATVPYSEQFTYSMDFLDDERFGAPQYDDDFDEIYYSSPPPPSTSSEASTSKAKVSAPIVNGHSHQLPRVSTSLPTINNNNKRPLSTSHHKDSLLNPPRRIRTIYANASGIQRLPNTTSDTARPLANSQNVISEHGLSPNENDQNDSNHQYNNNQQQNQLDDDGNAVVKFDGEYPQMLGDVVGLSNREQLLGQFMKIVHKVYSRCRSQQHEIVNNRFRRTMVKKIDFNGTITEIKRHLVPPGRPATQQQLGPTMRQPQNYSRLASSSHPLQSQETLNNNKSIIMPIGANSNSKPNPSPGVSGAAASQQPTPTMKPQQFVGRKFFYTPSPATTTTTTTASSRLLTSQTISSTLNRVIKSQGVTYVSSSPALSTSTVTAAKSSASSIVPAVPIMNGGNIRLTPKVLQVRQVGKSDGMQKFYIFNPAGTGQTATLVPITSSTTTVTGAAISQQPARFVIQPKTGSQSVIATKSTTFPIATPLVNGSGPTQLVAVNTTASTNNSTASNSIKLILNPTTNGVGSVHALQSINRGSIRIANAIGQPAGSTQHVVIAGNGSALSSLGGGPSRLLTLKPQQSNGNLILTSTTSNLASTSSHSNSIISGASLIRKQQVIESNNTTPNTNQQMVSSPNVMSHINSQSISSQPGSSSPPSSNENNILHDLLLNHDHNPSQLAQAQIASPKANGQNLTISQEKLLFLLKDKKLLTILANVLYTLYQSVPNKNRPFNFNILKRKIPQFLRINYYQLCNDILRIISDENNQSKDLLNQLREQLKRQQQLLARFNDLKAQLKDASGGGEQALQDIPSFDVIKPICSVMFTTRFRAENTFRLQMRRILRKELYTLIKLERRNASLQSILCYEQVCNQIITQMAQNNSTQYAVEEVAE